MGFAMIKEKARSLFEEASWIVRIENNSDYKNALALMDELIEDYDNNRSLIEMLSASIEHWENEDVAFKEFNKTIQNIDSGVGVLRVLMDQHHLGVSDFPEIGSKSLVSKILNHERRLTVDHIDALCKRFGISPKLFF